MEKKHARLSPSSADRWTSCTASPAAQDAFADTEASSEASRMGTVCHQIAEECLLDSTREPDGYLGLSAIFQADGEIVWVSETQVADHESVVRVTEDMTVAVSDGVAFVREQHALRGGRMLVEQRVPVGQFTGEPDAFGSADVILLGDDWVEIYDFKFGRKRVYASKLVSPQRVDFITGAVIPEQRGPNLQMACYALGALHAHDVFCEIVKVTMVIVQPYLDWTDSYTCSVDELRVTEQFLADKARETETSPVFAPSFDNCLFCLAKGTCDAQSRKALTTVFDMFDDHSGAPKAPGVPSLGSQYALVHFVERWVDDVQLAVRRALENGDPVVRDDGVSYKLVEGKNGPRHWVDETQAEEALKKARLRHDQMYSYSLISPTQAEKLAKVKKTKEGEDEVLPVLGSTQWAKLQTLISQRKGAPQIALETDPRPAVTRADGFTDT